MVWLFLFLLRFLVAGQRQLAAEGADLRSGMVVVEAAGRPVKSAKDLRRAIRDAGSGDTLLLRVESEEGRGLRALTMP
mgnify:CR=1 FL=1